MLANPLLKESAIGSIILENPFYGKRKPKNQVLVYNVMYYNNTTYYYLNMCFNIKNSTPIVPILNTFWYNFLEIDFAI